jgi:hypothetical protein
MTHKKDDPKVKIHFAPGAFDNFDGTQEELDEFIADITAQAESGELLSNSEAFDINDLINEDLDAETAEMILEFMDSLKAIESSSILGDHDGVLDDDLFDNLPKKRTLH